MDWSADLAAARYSVPLFSKCLRAAVTLSAVLSECEVERSRRGDDEAAAAGVIMTTALVVAPPPSGAETLALLAGAVGAMIVSPPLSLAVAPMCRRCYH